MPSHSLTHLNTLRLAVNASSLVAINCVSQLEPLLPVATPTLVLGGGSNILFTQDFHGLILQNCLKGISYSQDEHFHYLDVAGGENWHELVMYCAQHQIGGLENLALIPGTVGAAPVQNIGAYGVEFSDVCHSVSAYHLGTGELITFEKADCQFGYRESYFKTHRDYFIHQVRLKLAKKWVAVLDYGELKQWAQQTALQPSISDVAHKVIEIRELKLPNPEQIPNLGSFFKNPLVSSQFAAQLKLTYPDMPQYPTDAGIKLAAGWLIDQLGLKGYTIGGAAVHQRQALVLINQHQATAADMVKLADYVRSQVKSHYGVAIEPEVNFIDASGYSHLNKVIKDV